MILWSRRSNPRKAARSIGTNSSVSNVDHLKPAAEKGKLARGVNTERFRGHIDRVQGSVIEGWCCDTTLPNEAAVVEAVVSDGRRVIALASIFRQDVLDAGFGNGKHGFRIDVSGLALNEETVVVRFLHGKATITSEPISLDARQSVLSDPVPPAFRKLMHQLAAELMVKHAEMRAAEARRFETRASDPQPGRQGSR